MNWDKSDFDDDLKHALKEDRSRGTRKGVPDQEKVQEKRRVFEDMKTLLQIRRKKEFISKLTDVYGLQEGTDSYKLALQAWHEHFSSRKKSK